MKNGKASVVVFTASKTRYSSSCVFLFLDDVCFSLSTPTDESNDRTTLDRALDERLVLIVKPEPGAEWRLPESAWQVRESRTCEPYNFVYNAVATSKRGCNGGKYTHTTLQDTKIRTPCPYSKFK